MQPEVEVDMPLGEFWNHIAWNKKTKLLLLHQGVSDFLRTMALRCLTILILEWHRYSPLSRASFFNLSESSLFSCSNCSIHQNSVCACKYALLYQSNISLHSDTVHLAQMFEPFSLNCEFVNCKRFAHQIVFLSSDCSETSKMAHKWHSYKIVQLLHTQLSGLGNP